MRSPAAAGRCRHHRRRRRLCEPVVARLRAAGRRAACDAAASAGCGGTVGGGYQPGRRVSRTARCSAADAGTALLRGAAGAVSGGQWRCAARRRRRGPRPRSCQRRSRSPRSGSAAKPSWWLGRRATTQASASERSGVGLKTSASSRMQKMRSRQLRCGWRRSSLVGKHRLRWAYDTQLPTGAASGGPPLSAQLGEPLPAAAAAAPSSREAAAAAAALPGAHPAAAATAASQSREPGGSAAVAAGLGAAPSAAQSRPTAWSASEEALLVRKVARFCRRQRNSDGKNISWISFLAADPLDEGHECTRFYPGRTAASLSDKARRMADRATTARATEMDKAMAVLLPKTKKQTAAAISHGGGNGDCGIEGGGAQTAA